MRQILSLAAIFITTTACYVECLLAQQPSEAFDILLPLQTAIGSQGPDDPPVSSLNRLPMVEPLYPPDTQQSKTTEVARQRNDSSHFSMDAPNNYADSQSVLASESSIPNDFTPWWQNATLRPLRQSSAQITIDVNSLIVDALLHSARVRAISDNAVIAQTSITRAKAEFDVQAFVESKFVRTSVPTGSTLDAGTNVSRLRESEWSYNTGVRRKNRYGGRYELTQQMGALDSNSQFLLPTNQGNSRLTLSYNHPLLNGAGEAYNSSLIVLADIDTQIASNRTTLELQNHLLAVVEAMWDLYKQRIALLLKDRSLDRAQVILTRLEKRREIDALESQIARAQAAVSRRRAELIRAAASIRNVEARIRALVNSPTMLANRYSELVPRVPPTREFIPISLEDAVLTALENRPEINVATQEIKAAAVRLMVSKNELMPVLDLVLESYVSGLRGSYGIGQAWVDQFGRGEPSYTVGFVVEVPILRRAAMATHRRRQLELRQLSNRLQVAIESLHAEVEVAVREVETTYRELQARYTSMIAAEKDVSYLQRRWEELPGDDRAASFLLADLLDAQDRHVLEEIGMGRAEVDYTLSLTRLNRTTGTLLKHEQIEVVRVHAAGLPTVLFEKRSAAPENVPIHAND